MDETTIAIGEVASRAGIPASALRFYEAEGLIRAHRSSGGQRRFHRDVLRRLAFIRIAQRVGLTLVEIREALGRLPASRTPTKADWAELSRSWRPRLDAQIATLERLRDRLTSCIGCGCLSLQACALYNPADAASVLGAGPRYLLGDTPSDLSAAAISGARSTETAASSAGAPSAARKGRPAKPPRWRASPLRPGRASSPRRR